MRLRITIMISLLLSTLILSSCASVKPIYFNDGDKLYTDVARTGVCSGVDFDCVVMSQGMYRTITTVNPVAK